MVDFSEYLSGRRLYGDDFDRRQIAEWTESEQEAYSELGDLSAERSYGYHALNEFHGYRHLPTGPLGDALGFGSAFGDELLPIATRLSSITIVEPSAKMRVRLIAAHEPTYVTPSPDGELPFSAGSFDLVTCLGVLHHIPNVSFLLSELARVTRPGGHMLVREPIHSMGDWRAPRQGLTAKERGIPLHVFQRAIEAADLVVERKGYCAFSLTTRIARMLGGRAPFNSPTMVRVDAALASTTRPLYRYHAATTWQKVRPTSAFFILRPRSTSPPTSTDI